LSIKQLLILTCTLFSGYLVAQNLVVNGGFEDYVACPKNLGNLATDCNHLLAPTKGSTDFFHSCGNGSVGVPDNFNGTQLPFSGKGYAGLYLFSPNEYREYIQFKLKSPLEKGEVYQLSMRLSLAEYSGIAMQEITALFSAELLNIDTNENLSPRRLRQFHHESFSFINFKVKRSILDDKVWALVTAEYEAKGFERYLTFGNFKKDKYSRILQLAKKHARLKQAAYYYIDDVKVVKSDLRPFTVNEPFVLNQLQFEFDDFALTDKAKLEVEKVFEYLSDNPKIQVAISGHTDDLGSNTYNQYLSSRRARAVAQYLNELGIQKNRIRWEGKGDEMPLIPSKTDKARDANRRVEFVITKFEDH